MNEPLTSVFSPALRALIAARYPRRLTAWVDASVKRHEGSGLRIGYGHLIHPPWDRHHFGMTAAHLTLLCEESRRENRLMGPLYIDPTEADELLTKDLHAIAVFLNSVTVLAVRRKGLDLEQHQFDALSGVVYLTSQGRYATSYLRRAVHAGEFDAADIHLTPWPDLQALWRGAAA